MERGAWQLQSMGLQNMGRDRTAKQTAHTSELAMHLVRLLI